MNLPSALTQTARSSGPGSEAGTHLSGNRLVLARAIWAALVTPTLALFVIANILYTTRVIGPDKALRALILHLDPSVSGYTMSDLRFFLQFGGYLTLGVVLTCLSTLIWIAVGLVVFWRKSDDFMALLAALGLVTFGPAISPQVTLIQALAGGHALWSWLIILVKILGWGSLGLVFYVFPDGRAVPRAMRWLFPVYLVYLVLWGLPSSLFLSTARWPPVLLTTMKLGFIVALISAQIYRYRHTSRLVEQQQTKWVVFAIVLTMLADVVVFLPRPLLVSLAQLDLSRSAYAFISAGLYTLPIYLFPLTIGIAVLRYRLWDIDILINRTVVYGVLTISTVALYILVVVGLSAFLQAQGNPGIALLATGLVAVLFQPWRHRLQRLVNRLMYGDRDDPYRVISRLGQRLEAALAPEAVLPTIVETVAQALKLPFAAITLQQGEEFLTAASYGSARGELIRLPLVYQNEVVGELVLAPRAVGERFSPADRALLDDVARQAGIAAHAVRLTADLKQLTVDLQRSRERLVTAREEERRRLRRDLHDGLGPQLASLTLKLETARNRLAHDPLAGTLLSDLTTRTQATVADIRRLVYALRPPALDELGLLSGLRELALQSSDQVAMHLDAPACLPELSAAVEVAVYRIAQEALTNVVRHAYARRCDIHLALDEASGWLSLSIQDDGCGLPLARPVGVGLVSMRERAEELGGSITIEPLESGGTCVLARLPSARSPKADLTLITPSMVPQEEV